MTPGSVNDNIFGRVPPLLVVGIGNPLLSDDGVGLQLLEKLQEKFDNPDIEFVDGGTMGIALLGRLENRKGIIFLDAIALKATPGTVHILSKKEIFDIKTRQTTAHEGNAAEILKTAALLGDIPEQIYVAGLEPDELKTKIGLSTIVEKALSNGVTEIEKLIKSVISIISK